LLRGAEQEPVADGKQQRQQHDNDVLHHHIFRVSKFLKNCSLKSHVGRQQESTSLDPPHGAEIGIFLTAAGALFTFFGVVLFFDGALLAVGNVGRCEDNSDSHSFFSYLVSSSSLDSRVQSPSSSTRSDSVGPFHFSWEFFWFCAGGPSSALPSKPSASLTSLGQVEI
jgi:hypothetical protein